MPDVNKSSGMPSAFNNSETMNGLRPGSKGSAKYYPSPNEMDRLMKEEKERRRRMRIVQVREQAKQNAARIRHNVKNEYNKQVLLLAQKLQNEHDEEKNEKLNTLEQMYLESIGQVGQAHRDAAVEDSKPDSRSFQKWENNSRAQQRHRKALVKLHEETELQERVEKQHIFAREAALEQERARAFEVASRPPPPPDPVAHIQPPKVGPVKVSHAGAYSATHFHMRDPCVVERAESPEQIDAKATAKEQQTNYDEFEKDRKRELHEQREKARLRHNHALQKEVLKQDYNHLLHELSDLQRADAQRRSHVVAAIPRQIYQPPHRRMEEQAEKQVDMERDFEDVFLAGTNFDGDLSLCLDPQPVPPTPAATESLDLSTTLIEEAEVELENGAPPQESLPARVEASTITDPKDVTETMSEKLKNTDTSLKRLLERIQKQRDQWQQSTELPAVDDRSPESLVPTSRVTPGLPDPVNDAASSTNGGPTLTQYSCTSSDLLQRPMASETLETSETSESTAKSLSQRTISSAETLSNGEFSGALMHPLEQAAGIRQKSMRTDRLTVEKDRQDAMKREQDVIQKEIVLQQRELQELNKKIAQSRQQLSASEPSVTPSQSSSNASLQCYEVSPSLATAESLSQHTITSVDTSATPPYMHAQIETERIQKYLDQLLLNGRSIAEQNPRVGEYVSRALNQETLSLPEKIHDPYLAELDATITELDLEQSRLSQPVGSRRRFPVDSLNASRIVPAVPLGKLRVDKSPNAVLRSFVRAESRIEEQLREAEKEKEEMKERNQRHMEEIQRLKERWDREKEAGERLHRMIDTDISSGEERVEPEAQSPDRPSSDCPVRTAVSLFEDISFNTSKSDSRDNESTVRSYNVENLSTQDWQHVSQPLLQLTSSVDFYDVGFRPSEEALVIEKSNAESSVDVEGVKFSASDFPSVFEKANTSGESKAASEPTWFELLKRRSDTTSSGMVFKELEADDASEDSATDRTMSPPPVGRNTDVDSSQHLSSTPKSFNANNNNLNASGAGSFPCITSDGKVSAKENELTGLSLDQYKSPDTVTGSVGSTGLSQHSIGAASDSDTSFPDRRAIMDMLRKVTQRIDRQEELLDVLQRLENEGSDLSAEEKAELQQLVGDRLSSLGNGSGITDEPDITLVSLDSTFNHLGQRDDSSLMSHHSLLSFENHEQSIASNPTPSKNQVWQPLPAEPISEDSTPEKTAQNNAQWLIDMATTSGRVEAADQATTLAADDLTSIAITHIQGSSEISELGDSVAGLSLQEAFSRKRKQFIKTQAQRHSEAKAEVRKKQMKDTVVEGNRGAMLKSIRDWKQKKEAVGQKSAQVVEKTSGDRKKDEKEARARTERLYNRLDEVKEQKQVTDRKARYAANREKAKLYHQKHRELTKKRPS